MHLTSICRLFYYIHIFNMLLLLNINILLGRGLGTFSNKTKPEGSMHISSFHFNDGGSKVLLGINVESCQPTPLHE